MAEIERLPAYLLAGGGSRRFGSDKARALLDGTPLIVRMADAIRPCCSRVIVVAASDDAYADLSLPTIGDRIPDHGPLGGVHTALSHAPEGWALILSCDLLELRPAWVESLSQARTDAARAVAFRGDTWQPFPGLYHTAALPMVELRVTASQLSMRDALDAMPTAAVPLPPDWPAVPQANTPEDLQAYGDPPRS